MITVGLTGGIGSGKSTVGSMFEKLGATVIRADDLAKELMIKDASIIQQIKKTFGEESYFSDGSLNKAHLSEQAFQKNRVSELNSIVHIAVYAWFRKQKEEELQKGTKVLIREAALLLDKGRPEDFDKIIVVTASKSNRIYRVMQRDHVSEELVLSRMNKQLDQEKMQEFADFVIQNDESEMELKNQVQQIWKELNRWDQRQN